MHGYALSTGGRFRFYLQLIASRDNQETSLSAGVLDSRAQEPVNEFFENHLARKCLRGFNHCREIELFDRRFDRASRTRRTLVLPQPRMELIELPHLSICSASSFRFSIRAISAPMIAARLSKFSGQSSTHSANCL